MYKAMLQYIVDTVADSPEGFSCRKLSTTEQPGSCFIARLSVCSSGLENSSSIVCRYTIDRQQGGIQIIHWIKYHSLATQHSLPAAHIVLDTNRPGFHHLLLYSSLLYFPGQLVSRLRS